MALETIGSNPIFHPIGNSAEAQRRLGGVFLIKLHIGVSSSGKTQHFDCCIRRFESCHPSQRKRYSEDFLNTVFVDIARFFGLFWNFDSLTNFCVLHENTRESVNDSVNKNATENMLFKAGTIR